jgi:hypothetical protein
MRKQIEVDVAEDSSSAEILDVMQVILHQLNVAIGALSTVEKCAADKSINDGDSLHRLSGRITKLRTDVAGARQSWMSGMLE